MKLKALAVMALLASANVVSAAFIDFDFGDSTRITPGNYNNIVVNAPATLDILNAIDSTGAATGISLTASGFFAGSNTNGTTAPSGAAAIFNAEATRDNAFGHAGTFGTNPLTPQATLSLSGLDNSRLYSFTFFGSRTGVGNIRDTLHTVIGATTSSAVLDASNNVSNVAVVSNIQPVGGSITITLEPGPNNNSPERFYYLGAMRIDTGVVPEPATMLSFVIGGIGLAAVRRRLAA